MKFAVLLTLSLCVVAVSAISELIVPDNLAELCESEYGYGIRHLNYWRRWARLYGYPFYPFRHLRTIRKQHPEIPSTCKNVECPANEFCHLIKPKCPDSACPFVPICVKRDESGEWIDSDEWFDETPSFNKPARRSENDSNDYDDPQPSEIRSPDGVTPYQRRILVDGLTKGKESQPNDAVTYRFPTHIGAAGATRGYVNPGGPEIRTQLENPNSINVSRESYVNPGGPLIPAAEPVSDHSFKVLLDSLKLNNSESLGNSGSTDNYERRVKLDGHETAEIGDHQYQYQNSRQHYNPGLGAWPEGLRAYKSLVNPWTQRRRPEYNHVSSEWGTSATHPYDTFNADPSFETKQTLLKRVHRDK